ncbi:MAG: shikimate kinase [Treponema sp.]|jgi:shikimate kinase|nr:shikimate kinase [Treponema sp.]
MDTILLTGPKHAGKTSAGRALAALVSGVFIDLDEYIEAQTGKSPRTLYREGPGVFRKAEAEALEHLLAPPEHRPPENAAGGRDGKTPRIIAAGGGLIDNPEALEQIKKSAAATVYLEVPVKTAWERIFRAAEKGGLPPFLDTGNPRETHRALHEKRAAAYRAWARFTVNGEGKSPEEIAGDLLRKLAPGTPARAERR